MLKRTVLSARLGMQPLRAGETSSRAIRPAVFGSYRSVHRSARMPAITPSEARHRPTLRPNHQSVTTRVNGPSNAKRTIFIQTENTPNPDVSINTHIDINSG